MGHLVRHDPLEVAALLAVQRRGDAGQHRVLDAAGRDRRGKYFKLLKRISAEEALVDLRRAGRVLQRALSALLLPGAIVTADHHGLGAAAQRRPDDAEVGAHLDGELAHRPGLTHQLLPGLRRRAGSRPLRRHRVVAGRTRSWSPGAPGAHTPVATITWSAGARMRARYSDDSANATSPHSGAGSTRQPDSSRGATTA